MAAKPGLMPPKLNLPSVEEFLMFQQDFLRVKYSPRNVRIACEHAGLTHFGGAFFFHELIRVPQLRNFLARHLHYPRRNNHYHLSSYVETVGELN